MAATLDWSQCPAVESVPGRCSGAWVLRDTRMPISIIFESLEYGSTIEDIVEDYSVTPQQIQDVLEFAAHSLDAPIPYSRQAATVDAHSMAGCETTCSERHRSD